MADNNTIQNPDLYNNGSTNGVSGYKASLQSVNNNELVSNQLTRLLSSDNPYIQQARARGMQTAASRGQLNGLMAAGVAENAADQAGLPIATADAQEYSNVANANQQAENQLTGERIGYAGQVNAAAAYASAQRDVAKIQSDTSLKLQQGQLEQQQRQFDVGEQNWKDQFGLSQDEFNFQKDSWQQTFNQSEDHFRAGMSFQDYWNNRNMQYGVASNIYGGQVNALSNPNLTPEQRTAYLEQLTGAGSAYNNALANFPSWVPPW